MSTAVLYQSEFILDVKVCRQWSLITGCGLQRLGQGLGAVIIVNLQ